MAQQTLDDRVNAAQAQLGLLVNPQPPISKPYDVAPGTQTVLPDIEINSNEDTNKSPDVNLDTSNSGSISSTNRQGGDKGVVKDITEEGNLGKNTLPEPTPLDNTMLILEQRKQQAIESLKAEGFDGYTPDVSRPEKWNMDDQHSVAQAVQDIAAGFNISVAKAISAPREAIDRAMGLLGLDYMQHGSPQQQTIDAINRMGIPAYELENTANKIGQGALPALATFAAMQLAAPSMAANQGVGAGSYLMREVGQWAVKHPVLGLWLGQTSQAGGKVATHSFGDNPLTELGGELAGGIVGSPSFIKGAAKLPLKVIPFGGTITRSVGKATGTGIEAIANALPTDLGNAIKKYNPFYKQPIGPSFSEPLINKNFDANRLQTFAKDQIYGAQNYQDKAIENAINSIPTTGTSAQIQNRTHNLLQDAEKISKNIVSQFWRRVPLKTKIPVNDLRQDVISMRKELVDNDNTRPDAMIDKILQTVSPTRLPNGQFKAATPTITKLRDLQSQIGTAITEERAKDAPREGFVRNLARISEMIDDNIAKQLPNDTSIEQARQMSKRHNDLFSRGPINDVLSKRRTGDFRIPQSDSIDALMQKTNGLQALKDVQEGVSTYPRVPTNKFRPQSFYNNPYAVTPAEKGTLDQMVKSAEDSIRASFREAAEQGPQKAVAYSQKNEDAIKALSQVAGELSFASQKVSTALAEKKSIDASKLAQFAQTTPEKAVANIFAQRDPADTARQLMISFRGDPDALEGLRNQILDHFIYTTGKTNPNVMQKMINEPRIGNLLEATLAPDQYSRLTRMVNTAVRLGVEDETGLRQALASPMKTAGRIVGAAIGRRLNTGTIQGPAIVSKAVGSFMERALGATNPQDLLSQAVLDPNWESLLYSRIPTTTRDMKAAELKYRRIFAGINTGFQQTLNKLSKDNSNDE